MLLTEVLGVASVDGIDPDRPLNFGFFELGLEATAEARRILSGESFAPKVECRPRRVASTFYWSIIHQTAGDAELFGLPCDNIEALPTAVEVALVRAIAGSTPNDYASILGGNVEIVLGPKDAWNYFRQVIEVVERPNTGESIFFEGATQATVREDVSTYLNRICLGCLANSFRTSPLKFRFLELYRMIEARFLFDVKARLMDGFDAEPSGALKEAMDALKSEMKQIKLIAKNQQAAFESCWTTIHELKHTNRLASALFRKVTQKGEAAGPKWQTGAALVYHMRCAVVHAGAKDMIFESFPDGDDVITAILADVERVSLLLVGIELA